MSRSILLADDEQGMRETLTDILSAAERLALIEALDQARGDRSDAARLLALDRPAFYDKLKEFNLSS